MIGAIRRGPQAGAGGPGPAAAAAAASGPSGGAPIGAPPAGALAFGDVVAWLVAAAPAGAVHGRGAVRFAGEAEGGEAARTATVDDEGGDVPALAIGVGALLAAVPVATTPWAPAAPGGQVNPATTAEAPDARPGAALSGGLPLAARPANDVAAPAWHAGAAPAASPVPAGIRESTGAAAGHGFGPHVVAVADPAEATRPLPSVAPLIGGDDAPGMASPRRDVHDLAAPPREPGPVLTAPTGPRVAVELPPASPGAATAASPIAIEPAPTPRTPAGGPVAPSHAFASTPSSAPAGAPAQSRATPSTPASGHPAGLHPPPPRAEPARDGAVAPHVAAAAALAVASDAAVITPPATTGKAAPSPPPALARVRPGGTASAVAMSFTADGSEAPSAPSPRVVPPVVPIIGPAALMARLTAPGVAAESALAERRPSDTSAPVVLPVGAQSPGRDTAAATVAVDAPHTATGSTLDDVLPTQIVRSIRLQWLAGQGEAKVSLRPEYLGELTVSIKVDQGAVTATLRAETADVRRWLEAHSASLRDGLAEQGLRLDRLIVADERPRHEASADRRQRQEAADDEPSRRRRGRPPEPATPFDFPLPDSHERTSA